MTLFNSSRQNYRGRIAPTPTGFLHLGHAATFLEAQNRARDFGGTLVYRNEDLDLDRCKPEYAAAALEDLRWIGLEWQEGPDVGGPCESYVQSERMASFCTAWAQLMSLGFVYPCECSRKMIRETTGADKSIDGELIYPGTCRPEGSNPWVDGKVKKDSQEIVERINWRFQVPDGEIVTFNDGRKGEVSFVAGKDFGDFLVWRKDGMPSYELAVVVDDIAMGITEVVRGEDLLLSTARQLLLYRALAEAPPDFYHCSLVCDKKGQRLAKRDKAMGLRELRAQGVMPEELPGLIKGRKQNSETKK